MFHSTILLAKIKHSRATGALFGVYLASQVFSQKIAINANKSGKICTFLSDDSAIRFRNMKLLDENQVSEMLGIGKRALQGWRWHGYGPKYRKIGNRLVRYREEDVIAWVESRPAGGELPASDKRRKARTAA